MSEITIDHQALRRQTTRRQLQQIIAGLSDGVILLDPSGELAWANQAALEMHGVDELESLGGDVGTYRERFLLRYRNNHPLQPGQYPLERLLAGESFEDVVIEVAPVAEEAPPLRIHRARGLVLTDENDEADCLVLVVQDATDWALAEQRFERTFNANPAPALICRLSDQRYVKVNQGFLEMTGLTREAVIQRSVYQLDVFSQAERRAQAIERLEAGQTIAQMEAALALPDGSNKWVMVAGQPIDFNDEPCMLFTFTDLEPRRRMELALRLSEERFEKAFRMSPVPSTLVGEDFVLFEVNDAFVSTLGYDGETLVGRSAESLGLWEEESRRRFDESLAKEGSVRGLELQVRTRQGEVLDCQVSAERVLLQGEEICTLVTLLDITERRRSEAELVNAIEAVMQDASWFSRTLLEKLANVRRANVAGKSEGPRLDDLSAREREVLSLLCQGLADKEIARKLGLAPNTVRNHVSTIYAKLGLHSRAEAIVWARERGIFGLGY
ncbi:helix-turn-helix transcriptional regulator [Halotalea alkalilenta]|uniref:helix-turn-helix transcriptional regulator n=1 Tax=Halotalea alkalilenta TaxID=376489 RepID=UPI000693FC13|nr:helix-turn-helix transcriptional regulator [Halotalea alkalilenta]